MFGVDLLFANGNNIKPPTSNRFYGNINVFLRTSFHCLRFTRDDHYTFDSFLLIDFSLKTVVTYLRTKLYCRIIQVSVFAITALSSIFVSDYGGDHVSNFGGIFYQN